MWACVGGGKFVNNAATKVTAIVIHDDTSKCMQWPSGLPVKCRDNSLCVSLAPRGLLTLAISLGTEININQQCTWLLK